MLNLGINKQATSSKGARPRTPLLLAACVTLLAFLSGCGASGNPATQALGSKDGTGVALPAVTQPTPTLAKDPANTQAWTPSVRTLEGVTFSYRYPPNWSADLVYCPKPARNLGSHLPTGCASTDFLVGQKAADVAGEVRAGANGTTQLNVGGKRAVRQVEKPLDASKAAATYTVLVYDTDGAPLFGLATYIGPGTKEADQTAIVATLDGVVSTLAVGK